MGKKSRIEREEKRENFAAKRTRAKRKNTLMTAGVLGVVAVIVGIAAYNFITVGANVPGAPPGAGPLGSEHTHAAMLTRIHGDMFDYSASAYQIKSQLIHFESQDGSTIHKHATGVPLGYLFETTGTFLDDDCYVFPSGDSYCTTSEYSLKFYINGQKVDSIKDYVFEDGDRILISYGGEDEAQVQEQIAELEAQPILA